MLIQDGKEKKENASDSERKGMIGLFIVCSKQIKVLLEKKTGGKNQDGGYISARKTILWSLREGDGNGWKLICWIVIKNQGDKSS